MRALLVYKKSTYDFYMAEDSDVHLSTRDKQELKESHDANAVSIKAVEDALNQLGIEYEKTYRAQTWKGREGFGIPDLVIAVGGDGTFIEASRIVHEEQVILGINSDPRKSHGHYCRADRGNALEAIRAVRDGKADVELRWRIVFSIDDKEHEFSVMNDLLVHHSSPAGLTRYILSSTDEKVKAQEHYCSGLWIATPSGQSGALDSHDGPSTYDDARSILFKSSGFIKNKLHDDHILSGVVDKLYIISKMRRGKIYVDGERVELDFPYNATLSVYADDGIMIVQGF